MKKILPLILCSTVAALGLGALPATAGFVSPNVPERDAPAAARSVHAAPAIVPVAITVTTAADGGPGSLRDAIANAAPGVTINFALTSPATIFLTNTLVIDADLTITGPGPNQLTIMRSAATNTPSFRVFTINDGVVELDGLTVQNGRALNTTGFADNLGGAILNWGTLTVSNCVLAGNSAPTEFGGYGFGGAIFTLGPLTILNSTISNNTATWAGGGICTFHSAMTMIEGCTINGNSAGIQGGGVNFQGLVGIIQNSTISGNSTPPDSDGGTALLNIDFEGEGSVLTLTACTITRNFGSAYGAVSMAAIDGNSGQTNIFLSNIVADNDAPGFFLYGNPVLQSLGNNLDSDGTSGLSNGVNGDIVGTAANPIAAQLSPLQDNGGPTFTHALLPGSPALGTGSCVDANGAPLSVDQRGFQRLQTTGCDIGAFENQAPIVVCPAPQTVECVSACGTPVTLTATVSDPDGDALVVTWSVDGCVRQTDYVPATHPPASTTLTLRKSLLLGKHTVTISVSDRKAPPVVCSTTVTVQDTTPPKIFAIIPFPSFLWPASNQMVPVWVFVLAWDNCGPVTSRIISVSSNQPVGSTPDWAITGNMTVSLRAKTTPATSRRVYTITVESTDASGNKSTGTTQVIVPASGH